MFTFSASFVLCLLPVDFIVIFLVLLGPIMPRERFMFSVVSLNKLLTNTAVAGKLRRDNVHLTSLYGHVWIYRNCDPWDCFLFGVSNDMSKVPANKGRRCVWNVFSMMTSSNGNIFRVTGPLYGEFTGHRWIPLTKASDAEFWCLLWSAPEETVE